MISLMNVRRKMLSFALTPVLFCALASNVATAAPAAAPAPDAASSAAPPTPAEAPSASVAAPAAPPQPAKSSPAKPSPAKAPVQVPMPATAPAPAGSPPPQTTEAAPPMGAEVDDKDPRALEQFQTQLAPYGSWADDPKYGHVWVPAQSVVGENFSPYVTAGHWALDTDDNYVWVSDYPFGNVVFHYGRWAWTSYGWSWIPGYQYAPAWVSWRVPTAEYAYVGWAPLAPSFIWMSGFAVSLWYPPPHYWVFCPSAYLFAPYPYYHVVTYPPYVQSVGAYTRNYVAASPTVGPPKGPPIALTRVPPQSIPVNRVASGAGRMTLPSNAMPHTTTGPVRGMSHPRTVATAPAVRPAPTAAAPHTFPAPRVVAPPRTVTSPAVASRASFSPPSYRGYNPGFSSPRTYSPSADHGVYAPSSPRVYSPTSSAPRVYTPSYSPHVYSPASSPRVYSPTSAPHVYSPSVAPRVYSPPSVSPHTYSPSHSYSPSFGGAHTYGGGGHHR
jgi:hypothetical protein